MGKIKITRKVTVKQQVRVQRRVQVTSQPITYTQPAPQISTAPVQKALNDLSNELRMRRGNLNLRLEEGLSLPVFIASLLRMFSML